MLDAASEAPTNGDTLEHPRTISREGFTSSVSVSVASPVEQPSVPAEGHVHTTYTHEEHSLVHTNGHALDDYSQNKPKFELRAFHEEKKPAKLFTPGDEQPVRVTRRRPTEEVSSCSNENVGH